VGSVARKARARLQTKEKRGLINSILCTVCMYVCVCFKTDEDIIYINL
jgi:hypothetical protein